MATYICECEFQRTEDGWFLVWPFWPGRVDGTQGEDFDDAVEMAVDWLKGMILDHLARGEEVPKFPLGNAPKRRGGIVTFAVEASLDEVPAMTVAQAAGLLGVSQPRVQQLCRTGKLDSWKVGSARMVSVESVEMRLAEERRAGRPRREAAVA